MDPASMTFFTMLGLVVFWTWCFQLGYLLAFAAQWLDCVFHILQLERRVRGDLDVYAGWVAAHGTGQTA